MHATDAHVRPRSAPWGAVSLGIVVVALLAYVPSWGVSTALGALGFSFALPGLRSQGRSRALAWIALVLNTALFGFFIYLVLFFY